MSNALRRHKTPLEFAECLEIEQRETERHEFVGGQMYAIAGGTQAHHDAVSNAFALLHASHSQHCRVYGQGFKVRIQRIGDDRCYYPDVFVTCQPGSADAQYNEAPCVVVEVLSESTRRTDLSEKLDAYRALASVQTYLCIDPTKAEVLLWRRSQGWQPEVVIGLKEQVPVECGADSPLPGTQWLDMGALYRNIFP